MVSPMEQVMARLQRSPSDLSQNSPTGGSMRGTHSSLDLNTINPGGLGNISGVVKLPGGGPSIAPPRQAPPAQTPSPASPVGEQTPVQGVQGITPGAIERRLGVPPASLQARGGAMPAPSEAAKMMHTPNQMGPERSVLSSPLAGIQSLLGVLQSRQQRQL